MKTFEISSNLREKVKESDKGIQLTGVAMPTKDTEDDKVTSSQRSEGFPLHSPLQNSINNQWRSQLRNWKYYVYSKKQIKENCNYY